MFYSGRFRAFGGTFFLFIYIYIWVRVQGLQAPPPQWYGSRNAILSTIPASRAIWCDTLANFSLRGSFGLIFSSIFSFAMRFQSKFNHFSCPVLRIPLSHHPHPHHRGGGGTLLSDSLQSGHTTPLSHHPHPHHRGGGGAYTHWRGG